MRRGERGSNIFLWVGMALPFGVLGMKNVWVERGEALFSNKKFV
jgi:hypothetical protein